MSHRVPGYLCIAGAVLLLPPWLTMQSHLTPFPSGMVFNPLCQILSVYLLAASVFLGLYTFCVSPRIRRELLAYSFLGSLLLAMQFFADYQFYLTIDHTLNITYDKTKGELIAKAIVKARESASPVMRARSARVLYMLTGLELPYRNEDLVWTYYEPTASDREALKDNRGFDAAVLQLRQTSKDFLTAAVAVVIYTFETFLFGLLWLALKRTSSPSTA